MTDQVVRTAIGVTPDATLGTDHVAGSLVMVKQARNFAIGRRPPFVFR